MKSIGRNFTALIMAVIFTTACIIPVSAEIGNVSLIPDARNKSVSILGQLTSDGGGNYVVNIGDVGDFPFSVSTPPIDSRLLATYLDGYIGANANTGETIYLASSVGAGPANRYGLYIHYNDGTNPQTITRTFYIADPTDSDTRALLANLSTATKAQFISYLKAPDALERLGIDSADMAISSDSAYGYAFDRRPAGGYPTADTLTTANSINTLYKDIISGDVIYTIKTNGVAALTKNADYFLGSAYKDVYSQMTATEKLTLDTLLEAANYTDTTVTLSDIFSDKATTAIIKSAASWEVLGDKYQAVIGIPAASSYNNIADTNKYMVFDAMYGNKDSFTSVQDIVNSFNTNSVTYAALYPKTSSVPSQNPSLFPTGPAGSPTGGTQNSSGNILNPDNVPTAANAFTDINGHFAKSDIEKLAKLGFINGYPDNTYRPYNLITRMEFAKLVAAMFNITGGNGGFSDVGADEWFAPYVNALAERGIITGYNGCFFPNDNIKREDAVLMLQRAATLFNIKTNTNIAVSFADSEKISPYAREAVAEFSKMGIVNGDGVNFNPLSPITRGEVAAVLSRLYNIYSGGGIN